MAARRRTTIEIAAGDLRVARGRLLRMETESALQLPNAKSDLEDCLRQVESMDRILTALLARFNSGSSPAAYSGER